MPSFKFMVFTNPTSASDEAEFNRWYDDQHVGDVCNIAGVTGATRFEMGPIQSDSADLLPRYMAIYEIETDDLAVTLAEFKAKAGTDKMPLSETLDFDTALCGIYVSR